jgi:hypothetical protein
MVGISGWWREGRRWLELETMGRPGFVEQSAAMRFQIMPRDRPLASTGEAMSYADRVSLGLHSSIKAADPATVPLFIPFFLL